MRGLRGGGAMERRRPDARVPLSYSVYENVSPSYATVNWIF